LRLRGDILAATRVRCQLKKTVKCWAVNWIKETNQRGLSGWPSIFLKHKNFSSFCHGLTKLLAGHPLTGQFISQDMLKFSLDPEAEKSILLLA